MKEEFKKMWSNYKNRVHYIFNYKYNKEYDEIKEAECIEKDKKIERQKKDILKRVEIAKEKDELIALLNKRIDVLGNELTNTKKRNNELRNTIAILYKQNEDLEIKVEKVELLRRKKAGAIGGYTKEVNKLRQDLERANQKIHWLKTNQKAPTKEEIIAYETRMRDVETRPKGKNEIIQ